MKLAIVHPFLRLRGGAERVVLKIAQHFDAKVYCSTYEPENTFPEFREVDVEVMGSRLWPIASLLPQRVGSAAVAGKQFYCSKLDDYDVVNAQGTPSEWIRNRNSPVVWYCFSPNREAFDLYGWRMSRRNPVQKALYWSFIQPYRRIEFSVVPKIEHIFAISANVQKRIRRYLQRESEILMPGVDYENFHAGDYGKYFFYPSRIAPEKNFEMAIEAFKKFRRKHKGWNFVIAGSLDRDRPEHVAYYNKIKDILGNDGRIMLDLPTEKIVELYSNCLCVLYTPVNEDYGLIPLEAFASSKPCIAINEGGPRELVRDGVGYLVNNTDEMVERMNYLSEHKEEAERMGKAARKYAEREFSWKKFMDRFGEVCLKLSKERT
ncbi:MAG: glycosyltransferase family 4 protein [Candidatus Micrarchaeota archaeon]|nr:glycosyltransferase family 4 protein [Candidatus Micrarchaeota archaeon]